MDELRVFPSRALISFRMFSVGFSGLHAGEILKQVSVCQIDDFLEFILLDSQMYAQSSQRPLRFDASGRRDVSRRVVEFSDEESITLKISARLRESDVKCYTLRVIGFIQYKVTLSQVVCVLLSCRESRRSMPILEFVDYIDQQSTTGEIHINNLRSYTKAEVLVSGSK